MVVLEQGMKLEASLCSVPHNTIVLVWKVGKFDHTAKEVIVAYTAKANKKGKSQQVVELVDDAWEVSD